MTTSSLDAARRALWTLASVVALALTACGGGDDPLPAAQIGPAGGAVLGPNGAQVVVPAGALSGSTAIAVTEASSGNPPLPASHTAVGAVYAFTPHGQSFALPVTMTVPFDPALVPPGSAVKLFKTANGASGPWQEVPGATVVGHLLSGAATGFSMVVPMVGNQPPLIQTQPLNTAVVEPQTASFSVVASGTAPLTYQWLRSDDAGVTFTAINGATASSYTTGATSVANDNGDRYRVVVSNLEGSAQSIDVTLTVTLTGPPTAPLNISIVGTGTVASAPAGIDCGADCSEAFALNTSVTLTATPGPGFNFAGFSGDADCGDGVLTMSAARACTATFTAVPAPGTWLQLGGVLDVGPVGSASRDLFAAVALDLNGNPIVAWKGRVVGPGTSTNVIHVKRWDGANWVQLGANLMVTNAGAANNAGLLSTPSIDVDPSTGQPVVAWAENKLSGPCLSPTDVYVKRWDGSAWQPLGAALNVDAAACAAHPKVRVTATGVPIVAWWESPNWTAAKQWNGSAWTRFGGQDYVSSVPTGSQDARLTALTLDGSGNPLVVYGAAGGPFASQGSGAGWTLLGNGTPRTTSAAAVAWSAATDALGRLTVLLLTRDPLSTTSTATTLQLRRIDNGAWTDFGGPVLTADRNTVPNRVGIAIPFNTSDPIAYAELGGPSGLPAGPLVQSFVQWDGTAWRPLAANRSDPCELAVRANAATAVVATPVVACVRSAGNEDIVVYRLVP